MKRRHCRCHVFTYKLSCARLIASSAQVWSLFSSNWTKLTKRVISLSCHFKRYSWKGNTTRSLLNRQPQTHSISFGEGGMGTRETSSMSSLSKRACIWFNLFTFVLASALGVQKSLYVHVQGHVHTHRTCIFRPLISAIGLSQGRYDRDNVTVCDLLCQKRA